MRNSRSPTLNYDESENVDGKLQETALTLGHNIREALRQGSEFADKPIAYVNYARGDEGPEAWYGHDSWRLEKLKTLKKVWDPENKFKGYGPIPMD